MELSEYRNIYENEKEHFFYVSTHRLITLLILKWVKVKNPKILDAGCGTGGLMDLLSEYGETKGIDFSPEAVKFTKARGHKAIKASIEKIPFRDNVFDLVTSIDVIYHKAVKDDVKAIREFARILNPKGLLILRVPANKFLMSAHDKHVHTARRYSVKELSDKLARAGFEVRFISYIHSPLFIISIFRVISEKFFGSAKESGVQKVNGIVNELMLKILNFETFLISVGFRLPFGQGIVVVAQPTKRP